MRVDMARMEKMMTSSSMTSKQMSESTIMSSEMMKSSSNDDPLGEHCKKMPEMR